MIFWALSQDLQESLCVRVRLLDQFATEDSTAAFRFEASALYGVLCPNTDNLKRRNELAQRQEEGKEQTGLVRTASHFQHKDKCSCMLLISTPFDDF